jgi:hypothetical protein
VYGSDGANRISVDHGANYVDGRGGDDTIYGSNVELDDSPWGAIYEDDRDKDEMALGGAGDDLIVGATNAYGDAGDDTLIAGWHFRQTMTGGAGEDRFQLTDDFLWDTNRGDAWIDQHATITDFDPSQGDRIVIDRVDDGAPTPVFAGYLEDELNLEVGEYGIVGDRFVYAAMKGLDQWMGGDYEYVVGPSALLEGFTGTFTETDVLFI